MAKQRRSVSIGARLVCVGLSFLVPLAVMLFFLLSSVRQSWTVAQQELRGLRLITPMLSTLNLLVQTQGPAARLGQKDPGSVAGFHELQSKLRASASGLASSLSGPDGKELFRTEALALRDLTNCTPEALIAGLAPLLDEKGGQSPDAILDASLMGIHTLRQMIQYAAAETQLSRDPDLDSQSLLLALTSELPQALDLLGSTSGLLEGSLASGTASSEDRMEIRAKAALLQDNAIDRLRRAIEVSVAEDASFNGRVDSLTNSVMPSLEKYVTAQLDLIRLLRETTGFGGSAEKLKDLRAAIPASIGRSQELAEAGLVTLVEMLDQRRHVLRTRASVTLGSVLASLLAAVFVANRISRSISRPLLAVVRALTSGADHTTKAAADVAASSQRLAEGASTQASSLEETSASLEEITSMVKRNAEAADRAKVIASETRSAAAGRELSSQAESVKQSVSALQQLVGGSRHGEPLPSLNAPPAPARTSREPAAKVSF